MLKINFQKSLEQGIDSAHFRREMKKFMAGVKFSRPGILTARIDRQMK